MKRKLELNQCKKCQRTYNTKEVNATSDTCSHCNEKYKNEFRKKDALKKSLSRNENDKPCDNLEKLADIEEQKMNLIDRQITKILSAPFYRYNRWCVKVEIIDEGGKGETLIMQDTKLKVLEVAKVGNIIQG